MHCGQGGWACYPWPGLTHPARTCARACLPPLRRATTLTLPVPPSPMQSHNGMEIYNDDKDFVTSQLVSTRNIDPGLVCDWVCGGLNYQIE